MSEATCDICKCSFTKVKSLYRHQRVAHNMEVKTIRSHLIKPKEVSVVDILVKEIMAQAEADKAEADKVENIDTLMTEGLDEEEDELIGKTLYELKIMIKKLQNELEDCNVAYAARAGASYLEINLLKHKAETWEQEYDKEIEEHNESKRIIEEKDNKIEELEKALDEAQTNLKYANKKIEMLSYESEEEVEIIPEPEPATVPVVNKPKFKITKTK